MSLRSQILALIAIPLIALIGLGGLKGFKDWQRLDNAQTTQVSVETSLQLITLVHHLQVERGQSAAYLASAGKNMAQELPKSRVKVDEALIKISPENAAVLADLQRLATIRNEVTGQDLTLPDMAKYYTGVITTALELVSNQLIEQKNPELAQIGSGLSALSYAKESAGLQRAAGAAGIGRGGFALPLYQSFLAMGANEKRLLALANLSLHRLVPGLELEGKLQSSGIETIREQIAAAGPMGALPAMTAPEWFQLATNWITLLRDAEDQIAAKMTGIAQQEASIASRTLMFTAIGVAVAILSAATIGLHLILSFSKQMGALQRDLGRLSRKEFDFTPANLENKSEVGHLSRAMEVTRLALLEAEQKLAQIEESRIADRGAVVGTLEKHLGQLASRNLDCKINQAFPEEYESLRASFNKTLETLKDTIAEVITSSDSIASGAAEISQAADDLSTRTESQAATLEETAAALEELTSAVKSAADGAKSVEGAMSEARQEAEVSGQVVQNAVTAMTEIEQSSSKISQIIGVIDDIAFQTNLLALNAGVEAARAGESGRGFAVVASEVRSLAQRSADAATEIKALIEDSSKQVDHGVTLVGKAGEALGNITGRVNEISKLVTGIASSAEEQATGLGEINTGVIQLDRVTQQNAAMVEEATAAGHLLHSDADKMAKLVARFALPGGAVIPLARPTASQPLPDMSVSSVDELDPAPLKTGSDSWQDF
jgi:methyl-accepting chemotaxis protein